jgi:hypothetical protein
LRNNDSDDDDVDEASAVLFNSGSLLPAGGSSLGEGNDATDGSMVPSTSNVLGPSSSAAKFGGNPTVVVLGKPDGTKLWASLGTLESGNGISLLGLSLLLLLCRADGVAVKAALAGSQVDVSSADGMDVSNWTGKVDDGKAVGPGLGASVVKTGVGLEGGAIISGVG